MNILAFTKYADKAASARQRFLQFRRYLLEVKISLETVPLLDNDYLTKTFSGKRASSVNLLSTYAARFRLLRKGIEADALWLQYELFPYAPAFIERMALPKWIPVILDYDDAIFHQYDQHKNPLVRRLLGKKLQPLLRRADLAICGNAYLEAYTGQFCRRTEVVPTVVDTTTYFPDPQSRVCKTSIGWIGSPSTWTFVKPMVPLLRGLAAELDMTVRIVGAGQHLDQSGFEFLDWSEAAEIRIIQGMDLGIMPLPDEPWARGKCGYKLIQYMACGLPVIASPVGVNSEIIEHGKNGFLATSETEWSDAIRTLAADPELRRRMGQEGRKKIERDYSLQVHGPRLAEMLRDVIELRQSRI